MSNPTVLHDARARWLGVGALIAIAVAIVVGPSLGSRTIRAVDPGAAGAGEHVISVGATGTVSLAPDVCDIRIGVSITRETAAAARTEAASVMAKVIAALKAAGVADADLQTNELSLQPVYDYSVPGAAPRLTGYQMTNVVGVTTRAFDSIATVVDDAVAAGATTIDSIAFRIEDPTKAEDQARELAMADAKRRAEALASQAGVRIVGVASVVENTALPTPPIAYRANALDAGGSTPIQAGSNDVTVTVSVTYVIE